MSASRLLLLTVALAGNPALAQTHAVDLLRAYPGSPKIFVPVHWPDGSLGLFLVDTGADISTVAADVAARQGLAVEAGAGTVTGITHTATVDLATVPELNIGNTTVRDVRVAVGVPGQNDAFGGLPADGILGNNVWSRFLLELDYGREQAILHPPNSPIMPRRSAPLRFDDAHVQTPIQFTTPSRPHDPVTVVVALDTGANDLILLGSSGVGLPGGYTQGLEPVYGLGGAERMPPSAFLRETRRIPITAIGLGGHTVPVDFDARWLDYDRPFDDELAVRGLIGHQAFEGHRILIDYAGGRFALTETRRHPRGQHDAWQVLLDDDLARHGPDASERLLYRARLLLGMQRTTEAEALVERLLADNDPAVSTQHAPARLLAAALRRQAGDAEGAWALLSPLTPAELVDGDEIIAVVNGLLLDGRVDEAEDVAEAAVDARRRDDRAWVARADVLLRRGDPSGAGQALAEAARLAANPDAYLLRRARVALSRGDRNGALSLLRTGVQLNPLDGKFLWFYARLAGPEDRETVLADLTIAQERIHPRLLPHDYLAGALHALGRDDDALAHMHEGVRRDCESDDLSATDKDNCVAWHYALAGYRLDDALVRAKRAVAEKQGRPDVFDTMAMVHDARGELTEAHAASRSAARLAPADPYMLWQVDLTEHRAR